MKTCTVTVKQGILEGEETESSKIFRGIPYAEAPVGSLRFRAPVEKKSWEGVRSALEFGSQCPQPDLTTGFYGKEFYTDPAFSLPSQSEDCLYLNVWTPLEETKDGYPVAFWIHGGGFDHGFSSEMEFDGEAFNLSDVILVTINYRVGVFGFMADEELTKEDPNRAVGNIGILDQIAALKWVKENIAAFGGNPEKITVFGQSAGAMSVQTLITSPLTKGMIHGAMMQSAGGYENGIVKARTIEEAYQTGKEIKELCGVKTLEELRKVSADKLVDILPALYEKKNGLVFNPVDDGYVLTSGYDEALRNNDVLDIPYMIGCNANDLFMEPGQDGRESRIYKGCVDFAAIRSETSDQPCYVYYFARKLPGDDAGAFHSAELWYVFGTLNRCWRPMEPHDYQLSHDMVDFWTNFIKTGSPDPSWKPSRKDDEFVRTIM